MDTPMPPDLPERVAILEKLMEKIDQRMDRMDQRMDRIEANQRSDFRWMLTGFGALLAAMGALFWRVNDIAVQVAVLRTLFH
jgi:hypothetical protein